MVVAVLGGVAAVVATEAARIAHVTDVVGMRSPGHLHEGKYVLVVEGHEFLAGSFHQRCLCGQHLGMLCAIEGSKLRRNLRARLGLGWCRLPSAAAGLPYEPRADRG